MSLNYPVPLALGVTALAQDDASFAAPLHRHRDAQLIYARSGVVSVTTENGNWIVPPNRAVWVPPMVGHATRSHGPVQFRTIFIHPDAASSLPSSCGVVEVSPLLRELILRLVELQDPRRSIDVSANCCWRNSLFYPSNHSICPCHRTSGSVGFAR